MTRLPTDVREALRFACPECPGCFPAKLATRAWVSGGGMSEAEYTYACDDDAHVFAPAARARVVHHPVIAACNRYGIT